MSQSTVRLPSRGKGSTTRHEKVVGQSFWSSQKIWSIGTLVICAMVALPVLTVLTLTVGNNENIWSHLASTVLPHYLKTTALLMLGVGVGTFVIGVSTAWLTAMCQFPGKRIFEWALLLPLAMPAYIVAFVYTDLLEFAGPVQSGLRSLFGWQTGADYWFPEIRSLGGAIAMMTLTLYPYVYLLTRASFLEQSVCVIEVSRTLGCTPLQSFRRVALPLARPAIVIGLALVLMEALNDFGTVDFFGVQTFTAGIYDVWLNMNSVAGAAQLATVLLAFVIGLIVLERWARGKRQYQHTTNHIRRLPSYKLKGARARGAFIACLTPIALGFVVPAWVLLNYALTHYEATLEADYLAYLGNSLLLSGTAAVIALGIGLFLAYSVRVAGSPFIAAASRFAAIGYAVPGAVLAVGIMVPLGAFDNSTDAFFRSAFGISTGLLLSGTLVAVTFGYVVRFVALSFGAAEASLSKISHSMDGAARTLGAGPMGTLRRLHFPIIRASLLAGTMLVFVDGMKELPMTVILRPFNFETLATFVHQYASDELLEEAALGAISIVGVGIIPVILLSIGMRLSRPGLGKHRDMARC
ncbi:MAG: ABC transporter permease [Burkholderiaceae bacterium]